MPEEAHYWNAHGREWFEIDHLSVDPTVNAFTGITELKWGTTLEGAEKSMEYYFYLMFYGLHPSIWIIPISPS